MSDMYINFEPNPPTSPDQICEKFVLARFELSGAVTPDPDHLAKNQDRR